MEMINKIPDEFFLHFLESIDPNLIQKDKETETENQIENFIYFWEPLFPYILKLEERKKRNKNQNQNQNLNRIKLLCKKFLNLNTKQEKDSKSIFHNITDQLQKSSQKNFPQIFLNILLEKAKNLYQNLLENKEMTTEYLHKIPQTDIISCWQKVFEKDNKNTFFLKLTEKDDPVAIFLNFSWESLEKEIDLWIYLREISLKIDDNIAKHKPFPSLKNDWEVVENIVNQIQKKQISIRNYAKIYDNPHFKAIATKFFSEKYTKANRKAINHYETFNKQKESIKNFIQIYKKDAPYLKFGIEDKLDSESSSITINKPLKYFDLESSHITQIEILTEIYSSHWIQEFVWKEMKENAQKSLSVKEIIEKAQTVFKQIHQILFSKSSTFEQIKEYIPKKKKWEWIATHLGHLEKVTKKKPNLEKYKQYAKIRDFLKVSKTFIFFCNQFDFNEKTDLEILSNRFENPKLSDFTFKTISKDFDLQQRFIANIDHSFFVFLSHLFRSEKEPKPNKNLFEFIKSKNSEWMDVMELIDEEFLDYEQTLNSIRNRLTKIFSIKKFDDLVHLTTEIAKNENDWKQNKESNISTISEKQQEEDIENLFSALPLINQWIGQKLQTSKQLAKENLENIARSPKKFQFEIQEKISFTCTLLTLDEKKHKTTFTYEDFLDINMLLLEEEKKEDALVSKLTDMFPPIQEMISILNHLKESIHPIFRNGYSKEILIPDNLMEKTKENQQNSLDLELQKIHDLQKRWEIFQKSIEKEYSYVFVYSFDQIKILYQSLISSSPDKAKIFKPLLHLEDLGSKFKWKREKGLPDSISQIDDEKIQKDFCSFIEELNKQIKDKETQKSRNKHNKNNNKNKKMGFNNTHQLFLRYWPHENLPPIFVVQIEDELSVYETITTLYLTFTNNFPLKEQVLFCNKTTSKDDILRFANLFQNQKQKQTNEIFSIIFADHLSKKLQSVLISNLQKINPNPNPKPKNLRVITIFSHKNESQTQVLLSYFQSTFSQSTLCKSFSLQKKTKNIFIQQHFQNKMASCSKKMKAFTSNFSGCGKTFQIRKDLFKINCENENINDKKYQYYHIKMKNTDTKELIQELVSHEKGTKICFHFDLSYNLESDSCELLWSLLMFRVIEDKRCADPSACAFIFKPEKHMIYFEIPSSRVVSSEQGLNNFPPLKFITNISCIVDSKSLCTKNYEVKNHEIVETKNTKLETVQNFFKNNNINITQNEKQIDNLFSFFDNENHSQTYSSLKIFWTLLYFYIDSYRKWKNYPRSFNHQIFQKEQFEDQMKQLIFSTTLQITTRSFEWMTEIQDSSQVNNFRTYLKWKDKIHNLILAFFYDENKKGEIKNFAVFSRDGNNLGIFSNEDVNSLKAANIHFGPISPSQKYPIYFLLQIGDCWHKRIPFVDTILNEKKYRITEDNFLKFIVIQTRLSCGLPVIIIGETGCGKTSLINFLIKQLYGKKLTILNINGSTTIEAIKDEMNKLIHSQINQEEKIILFDEFNTAPKECIAFMKQLFFDRVFNGETLPQSVKFIALANPFRKQDQKDDQNLDCGLLYDYGEKTKDFKKIENAIYRVHEIPDSFFDHIYDFGALDEQSEKHYLVQMINKALGKTWGLIQSQNEQVVEFYKELLFRSHRFTRQNSIDPESAVSLRDASRALKILKYIIDNKEVYSFFLSEGELNELKEKKSELQIEKFKIIIGIILSIFVSYGCRFSAETRKIYYTEILQNNPIPFFLKDSLKFPETEKDFSRKIGDYREKLFQKIDKEGKLKDNAIAANEALTENLLLEFICLQNKIPLFIIGKPGTSKSLSIEILKDWLSHTSNNPQIRNQNIRPIRVFPLQCSPQTTSRSIQKIFNQAKHYQKQQNERENTSFAKNLSVVLLDEVSLAEFNPDFPLKVLHEELEFSDKESTKESEKIAVISISNWKLDASKINRGVFLQRNDPDLEGLKETGRIIFSSIMRETFRNDKIDKKIPENLATISQEIFKRQNESNIIRNNFFGLRDFYYLVKMVAFELTDKKKSKQHLKQQVIEDVVFHCFLRNFGGVPEFFETTIKGLLEDYGYYNEETQSQSKKERSGIDLVLSNLNLNQSEDRIKSRHVMILCENLSILPMIMEKLQSKNSQRKIKLLYGSNFPEDKKIQTYHDLKMIANFMSDPNIFVLCNQEQLFEPLYDLLNQKYVFIDGKFISTVSIDVSTTRIFVHPSSRIVVIMEKSRAYKDLSLAVLNRFEKQLVLSTDFLNENGKTLTSNLQNFFKSIESLVPKTKISDLLVAYHPDLIVSLAFKLQDENPTIQENSKSIYWHKIANLAAMCRIKKNLKKIKNALQKNNDLQEQNSTNNPNSNPLKNITENICKDAEKYFRNVPSSLKDLYNKLSSKNSLVLKHAIILTNSPPFHLDDFSSTLKDAQLIKISEIGKVSEFRKQLEKKSSAKVRFVQFQESPEKYNIKTFQHIKSVIESLDAFKQKNQLIILCAHLLSEKGKSSILTTFESHWDIYYLDDFNPSISLHTMSDLPLHEIYNNLLQKENKRRKKKKKDFPDMFKEVYNIALQKINKKHLFVELLNKEFYNIFISILQKEAIISQWEEITESIYSNPSQKSFESIQSSFHRRLIDFSATQISFLLNEVLQFEYSKNEIPNFPKLFEICLRNFSPSTKTNFRWINIHKYTFPFSSYFYDNPKEAQKVFKKIDKQLANKVRIFFSMYIDDFIKLNLLHDQIEFFEQNKKPWFEYFFIKNKKFTSFVELHRHIQEIQMKNDPTEIILQIKCFELLDNIESLDEFPSLKDIKDINDINSLIQHTITELEKIKLLQKHLKLKIPQNLQKMKKIIQKWKTNKTKKLRISQ
ncbi:hypothetical protein M0811_11859 [Anaeramoeba ignava]|uniref:AAA+ ATPase domain-containing protein n=1 Tax=Anaeramoeba ignava TaxID=1746090 RepID=A0A9Q0R795_ANAIG|nr:hypothetical protein M0811_11859 [Anaeramoeba ignava]